MNSKLSCSLALEAARTSRSNAAVLAAILVICAIAAAPKAAAGDAPGWMHALGNVPLPVHDDKTDGILLYSERILAVQSPDKIKLTVREAYKILRPDGRHLGIIIVHLNSEQQKVNGLRGWSIPAQGKDFEVKDKEAIEVAIPDVEGSELITDTRVKLLRIPGAEPGSI